MRRRRRQTSLVNLLPINPGGLLTSFAVGVVLGALVLLSRYLGWG